MPSLGPGQGRRTQGEAAAAAKASEPVAHGQLRSPSASARWGPGRAPLEAAALRAGAPTFSPDSAVEWGTEFPLRLCSREFVTKNVSSAASGNPMLRLPPSFRFCLFFQREHTRRDVSIGTPSCRTCQRRDQRRIVGNETLGVLSRGKQPGSQGTADGLSSSGESVPKCPHLTARCTRNANRTRSGIVARDWNKG